MGGILFDMVTINPILGDMVGSMGGLTFQRSRAGLSLKKRSKPTSVLTPARSRQRSILSDQAKAWAADLSAAQRSDWNMLASGLTWSNALGQSYTPSGFQVFMRQNSNLLLVGESALLDAPANLSVKSIATMSLVFQDGNEEVEYTFATPSGPTEGIALFMKINLPPGRAFQESMLLYAGAIPAGTTSPGVHTIEDYQRLGLPVAGATVVTMAKRFNNANGAFSPGFVVTSTVQAIP